MVLLRAARAKGFPFSSSREACTKELLPSFAASWESANIYLGRKAVRQGRHMIDSFDCTRWDARTQTGGRELDVHFKLPASREIAKLPGATELHYHVVQRDTSVLLLEVWARFYDMKDVPTKACAHLTRGAWKLLISFEGTSRDGEGYKKVLTHSENLAECLRAHAPALSFMDLAELLASAPVVPAAWSECIRAHILEDAAAEAAWDEGSCTSKPYMESVTSSVSLNSLSDSSHSDLEPHSQIHCI